MNNYRFIFESYKYNEIEKKIEFSYILEKDTEQLNFTEVISFSEKINISISDTVLDSLLHSIHLMLGISYWKLFCPKDIVIQTKSLTKDQANFWNSVYTKGLGEFFYENKIDYRGLVQFPSEEQIETETKKFAKHDLSPDAKKALVGYGGGKDSIVVGELLKKADMPFDGLIIQSKVKRDITQDVLKTADVNEVLINRILDNQIYELNNRDDVFNGHIPVSAIYGLIGILAAYLYGYSYFIVGNEESANYGNVEYFENIINHQWSKSYEFEQMLQKYIDQYTSVPVTYFSLLRPFSELKITQIFSQYPQYFDKFFSCNVNYRIRTPGIYKSWCCDCPKCAFVFILMAAFISKEKVVEIFGENLLNKHSLMPLYKELLGIEGFKPFECVGTPEESTIAFYKIHQKGEFEDDLIMKMFEKDTLPQIKNINEMENEVMGIGSLTSIPEDFKKIYDDIE